LPISISSRTPRDLGMFSQVQSTQVVIEANLENLSVAKPT